MEALLSRRREHPGDGSGAYQSSLDDGGAVDVSDTTRGVTRMARQEAAVAAGGRACSLTTVQCGATEHAGPEINLRIHHRFIAVCHNEALETPNGLFGGNQRDRKIMDPITASLAAKVVSVLAPYVVVGAAEFVRNAGKDAHEK